MKNALELKPILFAAVIGAVADLLVSQIQDASGDPLTSAETMADLMQGAIIGSIVQIGVRVLGVS